MEADGFDPTGIAARSDFKRLIRRARSNAGEHKCLRCGQYCAKRYKSQ